MLCDDPNKSSAVYLLTSDDKHSVCGTVFPPNQLLYQKYLASFFFVEETFDHMPVNEKDHVSPICRYGMNLGDFKHRHDTQGITDMKKDENRGKELKNM